MHSAGSSPQRPVTSSQISPMPQAPHWPSQPSGPHSLPSQVVVQVDSQLPSQSQKPGAGQVPQEPPQPSSPHCLSPQLGVQPPPQSWGQVVAFSPASQAPLPQYGLVPPPQAASSGHTLQMSGQQSPYSAQASSQKQPAADWALFMRAKITPGPRWRNATEHSAMRGLPGALGRPILSAGTPRRSRDGPEGTDQQPR